jgi:hypothetical protein
MWILLSGVGTTGEGGLFLCVAIEDEAVNVSEGVQFPFRRGIGVGRIDDGRVTHRTTSSARFSFRSREPMPMLFDRAMSNSE